MRFECQQGCTRCCEQEGFVYVTEADVPRIAAFLHLTVAEFEQNFLYRTKWRIRLRTPKAGRCIFLDESGCSIHEVKPLQCRAFPFWPEMVESGQTWRRASEFCPGIGKGEHVSAAKARAIANEVRVGYPHSYKLVTISSASSSKSK